MAASKICQPAASAMAAIDNNGGVSASAAKVVSAWRNREMKINGLENVAVWRIESGGYLCVAGVEGGEANQRRQRRKWRPSISGENGS
jgi:hypothetical protein